MTQAAVTGSRSGAYIFGIGVQSAQGTAASTYNYIRWQDGTEANLNPNVQFVYEGDGSNQYLLAYKKGMWWEWTCKYYPRGAEAVITPFPIFGKGADQGTGAVLSTYTASTGAPYQHVASLVNPMQYVTIKSQFTPVGTGNNAVGVMTLVDACISKLKISGKMGEPIAYEMSGYAVGVDTFVLNTPISSPTYDTSTQVGMFYNAIYTPNSHVVGTDAANIAIQDFEINIDRHVNPEDMLTTLINPQGLVFTQTETTCSYTLLWQDWTDFWQAYTNSTSTPSNLDQQLTIGSGSFQVNLTYLLANGSASDFTAKWTAQNIAYLEGKLVPHTSNKPLSIKFNGKCLRNLSGAAQTAGAGSGQDGIAFVGTHHTLATAIC